MNFDHLTPVLTDAPTLRARVHAKVVGALQDTFPLDLKGRTLEVKDLHVHARDFSPEDQKRAILEGKSLHEVVKGTMVLKGADGKVIDEAKNFTLVHVPYFTERHTVISKGNEYQVANMLRRKPGVYTQRGENGELHTVFNLSKGQNFNLVMNPEKGTLYVNYKTTNLPLYPILREMGATHDEIAKGLGSGVAQVNEAAYAKKTTQTIDKLYKKLVHPLSQKSDATHEMKSLAVREKFGQTAMDSEVVHHTLGHKFDKVSHPALLVAARRLLDVHNNKNEVDDSDSLAFKTFHSVDDFLGERLRLTARDWKVKARYALHGKDRIRDGLRPAPFSDSVDKFITTSPLTAVPTGINPIELLDHATKVTALGEGGIPSERAVPYEARLTHPTHYGTLDPIRTPESGNAGVDLRATIAAHRDDQGNLYAAVLDKHGKRTFIKSGDMMKYVVAFPHQKLEGMVDAFVGGQVKKVPASQVQYQVPHLSYALSPSTALIPMLHNIQGNRAIMGAKMQTQGLPLIHREVPLVQVESHLGGRSFEDVFGHMVVPTAPVRGTVEKIDNGFIFIRPDVKGKTDHQKQAEVFFDVLEKTAEGNLTRWWNHAALNAGLAGRDARYVADFPGAEGTLDSMGKRLPRLAKDVFYGVIPPQWTHGDDDLSELDQGKMVDWMRHGYAPWDHENPATGAKEAAEKTKADPDHGLVRVPFQTNFPFPSKTFLHHDLSVQVGQRVNDGDKMADSNFTRKGTLALGTNLRIAYMPYMGLNSNDAVVISEGAAKKLTSEHMYREVFPITAAIELSREKHRTFFGGKYQPNQYAHLDAHGVVLKGSKIHPKDLLVVGLVKNNMQGADAMLGRISKQLTRPYREVNLTWEHGVQGEVVEVVRTDNQISILIKTLEQMQIGDKLSGRYGNKGVVAKIIPDHQMLKDEAGNVIDSVFTSAGVVSRINPAQIIETAVSKVADKTGKPIIYNNANPHNAVQWAKDLLKEHGIKDREHVYDPISGRTIKGDGGKGVLVGKQYVFKLFKSTDTNFSGHAVGPYDVNEQPVKVGGDESAKGLGKMELDALLAHNARNVINEAANIKGQKNDEFWRSLQLGLPLPGAKPSFAFNKFVAMMEGAGVKVDKRDSKFRLLPLTDKDVLARSAGAIQNSKTVVAKNLKPENGGLFDPRTTGGPQGNLYSHIDLHEAVVNPVFMEPVRRLLGMTEKEFERQCAEKGGDWFHGELSKIDVAKKIAEVRKKMVLAHGPELNNLVKQTKYLTSLQREGLKPQDAYVISKIPVVPPIFRPIVAMPNDPSQLMVADSNKLYAHLMSVNHAVKTNVLPSAASKFRGALFNAVGAVYGTHEVEDEKLKGQSVKGFLTHIAGKGSPKGGFFQRKLMFRTQDVSGRGTIVPDGTLHMDQIGLPEEMLWKMLDRLIVARLVRTGYDALSARSQTDKRTPVAREAMLSEVKERPFIFNRAPTLHRFSMVAGYAVPVQGKTIRMNPFAEVGLNADYDGDTLQIHTPITGGAVEDAKKMLLSKMLLSDQSRNKLMVMPRMESVMGITQAAGVVMDASKKTRHFDTKEDLMAAYRKGDVELGDPIEVRAAKTAAEPEDDEWLVYEPWTTKEALACYPAETVSGLFHEPV